MMIASRICLVIAFLALIASVAVPLVESQAEAEIEAAKRAKAKAYEDRQMKAMAKRAMALRTGRAASTKTPRAPHVPATPDPSAASTLAMLPAAAQASSWPAPAPAMHKIHDADWIEGEHVDAYNDKPSDCRACHGIDLEGTPQSRVPRRRVFKLPGLSGEIVVLEAGESVSCASCHEKPDPAKR